MAKIDVFNQEAKAVKSIELSDAVFGIEPNQQAMYDAILVYQAGLRQGTHATLTCSSGFYACYTVETWWYRIWTTTS